jgi:predicted ATPase
VGLEALAAKSLIQVAGTDDEPRFGMLATTRAFARARLEESGEAADVERRLAALRSRGGVRAVSEIRGKLNRRRSAEG